MNSNISYRWIPLESNPSIFNDYFYHLGLSKSFSFEELFSFDYKEVQNINISLLDLDTQNPRFLLLYNNSNSQNTTVSTETK